jgi:hypothetical protein
VNIYDYSIASIDDPRITAMYATSPIRFFQKMYTFLLNAIPSYINPIRIIKVLEDRTNPDGVVEDFVGNGVDDTFVLSTTPLTGSFFEYKINGVSVTATYNSITNAVTFPYIIPTGQTAEAEWYYAGQFNITLDEIVQKVLGQLLVCKWALQERNFLMDVRRLLNDTDFKLNDNASATNSKIKWYDTLREEAEKSMNQHAWDLHYRFVLYGRGGC